MIATIRVARSLRPARRPAGRRRTGAALACLGVLASGRTDARAALAAQVVDWAADAAAAPPVGLAPGSEVLEGGRRHSKRLVVALHGGSWRGATAGDLALRTLDELSPAATRAGLRLLVPPAPSAIEGGEYQVPWTTTEGELLVLSLLEAEVASGRAAGDRLYLAGHGAGATGALTLAARHPDLVAAVAVWSGTPEPQWDEQRRVVGLAGDVVARLAPVPVYLWTGTDDRALDGAALQLFVEGSRSVRRSATAAPLVWEQAAGGHGYGPAGPERGLRFLATRRLPARRRPAAPAPAQGATPGPSAPPG